MGRPTGCGITHYPIDSGDDIMFMIVKQKPFCHMIYNPFDAYEPVTPLFEGSYNDDGTPWIADEIEQEIVSIMKLADDEEWDEDSFDITNLPEDHHVWMISKSVYEDLLPKLGYSDYKTETGRFWRSLESIEHAYRVRTERLKAFAASIIGVDVQMERFTAAIRFDKQYQSDDYDKLNAEEKYFDRDASNDLTGYALQHTPSVFRCGEGTEWSVVKLLSSRVFAAKTKEELDKAFDSYLPIFRVYCALIYTRQPLMPSNRLGMQDSAYENTLMVAEYTANLARAGIEKDREEDE